MSEPEFHMWESGTVWSICTKDEDMGMVSKTAKSASDNGTSPATMDELPRAGEAPPANLALV